MRCMNLFNLLATALSLQFQALRGGSHGVVGPQCHRPQALVERVVESVRTLVMQFDLRSKDECATQHYRGSLYGVTATVALEMATREAHVELRGVPLGGTIAGIGWLKNIDGEVGEVELEEAFAAALAWRMVSIQAASLDRHANTVTVHVTVPLLGAQQLALKRVNNT
jgi:hypothetical protein|tara:strand:- start:7198 stop:7701 length:504 start_codon:yes stop_codon:yes gene_type:complete